jgi:hypothetical protein
MLMGRFRSRSCLLARVRVWLRAMVRVRVTDGFRFSTMAQANVIAWFIDNDWVIIKLQARLRLGLGLLVY